MRFKTFIVFSLIITLLLSSNAYTSLNTAYALPSIGLVTTQDDAAQKKLAEKYGKIDVINQQSGAVRDIAQNDITASNGNPITMMNDNIPPNTHKITSKPVVILESKSQQSNTRAEAKSSSGTAFTMTPSCSIFR